MWEKYAQGCMLEFLSACMRTAPAANREALVIIEKGWIISGICRTGVEEKICLRHSKASCWSQVQIQGFPLQVSRFRGAMMLEKSGMNFL